MAEAQPKAGVSPMTFHLWGMESQSGEEVSEELVTDSLSRAVDTYGRGIDSGC